jgi:hypothetical protein
VLPAMDYILELFEEGKEQYKDDIIMGPCINSGWSKLVKYYNKTSESPAYVAALVLNPAYKWEYIESTWEQDWIPSAREAIEDLWKSKYQPKDTYTPITTTPIWVEPNQFSQWKHSRQATK